MPKKILLIQDDAEDAGRTHDALVQSADGPFLVEWVRRCDEALQQLIPQGKQPPPGNGGFAAILVDLFLPDSQGLPTFERLYAAVPQIPILVLVANDQEELARETVKRGAQDYLLKSRLDNYLLPKALRSMIERATIADSWFAEKERAEVTLNSIGDAVISTNQWGQITYLNAVAETLTGWKLAEAANRPAEEVFHIIDATTREAAINPMALSIQEDKTVGLSPNCVLIRRDGAEAAIEDSAAPIHDRSGRVTGAVMVFHDVSAARALSQRMSYLAQHDGLTDLPNRILFNDRLSQAMSTVRRNGKKLAVLYLDIDRFKHINDSLGHTMGDRLLQSVSKRLLACVRSSDTVSRQGGDEFVILLAGITHAEDAALSAEKILLTLSERHHIDQSDLHVTASIGIVTYPDDGTDAESLLKNADFAMYQAKDSGRNNFQFFNTSMNSSALERQALESDLRHAVEKGEFLLHYQPKINLESGIVTGFEALLRWNHPRHTLVSPAQFISIAEESGLVVPIGRWALRESCRQARAWQLDGQSPLQVAVNVSAVELRARDYVNCVRTILSETGLDPALLELELTETFLMQDSNSTGQVLQELKALGISLALDDFGTGFSSLSYLKRFPIDALKIDQSFVRDLASDQSDASIVSAVINMGKSLHMQVIAEGVETREQCDLLRLQQCPEGQGYYFGKPMEAENFARFMARPPPVVSAVRG
jgi:diguanylate cyclase (GGDEF)-like protein/PAS domain S-box-containing protein